MSKRTKPAPDINVEIRRLQKVAAPLICAQYASSCDVEFDVADALSVIITLVDESLAGLDRIEVGHAQS